MAVAVKGRNFCDANVDTSDLDFLEPLISYHGPSTRGLGLSFMERFGLNKRYKCLACASGVFLVFVVILSFYCTDDRSCWGSSTPISRIPSAESFSRKRVVFNDNDYYLGEDPSQQSQGTGRKSTSESERPGYRDIMEDDFEFDIRKNDVMVFLHIQKTGGTTFGKHLVEDLNLEKPCVCHRLKFKKKKKKKKRCDCYRPTDNRKIWLFSRYSTGWRCGLHADWTELNHCVDKYLDEHEGPSKRRYFYVTLLRDPVNRYLSEFAHVRRGATWRKSVHLCAGRPPTPEELPSCYSGDDWSGVGLDEFLSCDYNLAANRQTRMLADLELVGCYNRSYMPDERERNRVMLASAKKNLESMAYFGLTEYQKFSQYIFEETFNFQFAVGFEQYGNVSTHSGEARKDMDEATLERVKEANALDIELYKFANKKFFERFESLKAQDAEYEGHFASLNGRK